MSKGWRVAVLGATGLVGETMISVLEERDTSLFQIDEVRHVVDVPEGVHVGPPQRAAVGVPGHAVSPG